MTWGMERCTEDAQVELLAHVAVNWGFDREPTRNEIERGDWFAGYRGQELSMIYWFERVLDFPEDAGLHYVISPRVRGHWPVRQWLEHVVSHARQTSVQRLHSHVEGLALDYLPRYVEIWNRRHDDTVTIESSQPLGRMQAVVIDLGDEPWES